jgi:hypothetical protein
VHIKTSAYQTQRRNKVRQASCLPKNTGFVPVMKTSQPTFGHGWTSQPWHLEPNSSDEARGDVGRGDALTWKRLMASTVPAELTAEKICR